MPAAATATPIGHNQPPPLKDILAENYRHFAREIEDLAKRAYVAPSKVANDTDLDAVGVIVKDAKAMLKRVDGARKDEKEPHLQAGRDVDAFFKVMTERLDNIARNLEDRATVYQRAKATEARRKAEEEAERLRKREEAERRKAEEAEAAGRARTADKAGARADAIADQAAEAERKADAGAAELARTRGASGTVAGAKTNVKIRIVDLAAVQRLLGPLGPYIASNDIQRAANAWLKFHPGVPAPDGLEVYEDVRATFR